jgi:hypothetical protein
MEYDQDMSTIKERITVTLDPALLERLDVIAEARGDSRSAVIERCVRYGLAEEERFLKVMENPVTRAVFEVLAESPMLMSSIATVVGDELSPGELEKIAESVKKQGKRGRERSAAKRAGRPRQAGEAEG